MVTIFMICAVVGSVIVVVQFIMTLAGMGHDWGGDFTADAHVDFDHGAIDHAGNPDQPAHEGGHFFGLLTFRAVTSAVAVFGLAGLASITAGLGAPASVILGLAAGAAALVSVAWAMKFLYGLRDDGTVRIERALGQQGTVYLTIPGDRAGQGKVFLNVQNRTVECQAITAKRESLPTGSQVVVVSVLGPNMVEVEPCMEQTEREKAIHV